MVYHHGEANEERGFKMTIDTANRLVALRRERGLSQEDLAAQLGISRQAISKWERGEASPDVDNLIGLARFYGVTVDELLGEKPLSGEAYAPEAEPFAEETVSRTGTADGVRNLKINARAKICIVGEDRSDYGVTLSGSEEEQENTHIDVEGDTLVITTEDEEPTGFGRLFKGLVGRNSTLRIEVAVPRRMNGIDIASKGGSASVHGLTAERVECATGGGGIEIEDVIASGGLISRTGGGGITVRDSSADSAELLTGGGGIDAVLAANSIKTKSGGGGVTLDVTGANSVSAMTGGGSIGIRLRSVKGASASLVTGGGRLRLGGFGREVSGMHKLSGAIGDGSAKVEAKSGGGSISVYAEE